MATQAQVYDFILRNCDAKYIADKKLYSAFMTVCGYDHQEWGTSALDAKEALAEQLSKSKFIQSKIAEYHSSFIP